MDKKTFEQYLSDRYANQTMWYSNRASSNKRCYQIFQWSVIILSSTLPALVASLPDNLQWITITVSIFLAIGTASLKTFKFQENWINYRTVSETLKKEMHFYNARLNNYSRADDAESFFVERVESITSRENSLWITNHRQKAEDKAKKNKV